MEVPDLSASGLLHALGKSCERWLLLVCGRKRHWPKPRKAKKNVTQAPEFSSRIVSAPPQNGGGANRVSYRPVRLCFGHARLAQGVLQGFGEKADFGNCGIVRFQKREAPSIFQEFVMRMLEKEHIA